MTISTAERVLFSLIFFLPFSVVIAVYWAQVGPFALLGFFFPAILSLPFWVS